MSSRCEARAGGGGASGGPICGKRAARWENDECRYIRHGAAYTATIMRSGSLCFWPPYDRGPVEHRGSLKKYCLLLIVRDLEGDMEEFERFRGK